MRPDSIPVVLTPQDEARFWAKVDRSGGPDACWPWLAFVTTDGYGHFAIGRKIFTASRVAWYALNREQPGRLFVCHHCDNPVCCNPSHLFLGDAFDNMRDASVKGRLSTPARSRGAARQVAGEKNPRAVLSEDDVREIRALHAGGGWSLRKLADRYGVHNRSISRAINGERWGFVS